MRIIGIDISKRGCSIAIAAIVYLLLVMLLAGLYSHLLPSPGSKVSPSSPKQKPSLIAYVVQYLLLTLFSAGIFSVMLLLMIMGGRGGCMAFIGGCACIYGVIDGIRNSYFPMVYMCSLLVVAYVVTMFIAAKRH